MKQVIGFAEQFYTLWVVSEPYKVWVSATAFYEKQDIVFVQNLSTDLETAKAKVQGSFDIDLTLRGEHRREWWRGGMQSTETEPVDCFPYGKLQGEKIDSSADVWQLNRLFNDKTANPRSRVFARQRLIELGELTRFDGVYVHPSEVDELRFKKSLVHGHFFTEGERVSLELKKIESFWFETPFGDCCIMKMLDKQNRVFVYKGSNPPYFENEWNEVKATVKYGDYNGELQTQLQRVKVSVPIYA